MEPDRLVACFESLGDSCEFGLVQREAGAEPLGLLRFAGFPGAAEDRLEDLVTALDRGFDGLGDPDTVEVILAGEPGHQEYVVRESVYGLFYHTFLGPTDVEAATLRRNETIRLRFLRRKLLTDLASAEKIFVWKCNVAIDVMRVRRLLAALRRHGPATLLWVCAADAAPGRVGSVEQLADGLLRGVIDRFAPYDGMTNISNAAWRTICATALALLGSHTAADEAGGTIIPASLRDLAKRAELDPSVGGIRGISVLEPAGEYTRRQPVLQDTAGLDPNLQDAYHRYYTDQRQGFDAILKVVLERALVTGQGAVITRDGNLLNESCWEFLQSGLVPNGLTDLGDQRFRLSAPLKRSVRDPALLLKRPWWRNYRQWLVDAASLLAFASTRLDVTKIQLVIGKEDDHGLRAAMHELLAMLAPGARILEHPDHEVWRFSDLHYITPVYIPPVFMLPAALSALHSRTSVHRDDPQSRPPTRRLYLWQGVTERPQLRNESAVIELCAEFGFEVVRPELHGMADRIAMFADAEAVIGVKAPQLANIAFCRPSTLVIALSPGDWPDPFHATLADQRGLRYAEIFGQVIEARRDITPSDFRIESDRVRFALESLLPGRMPQTPSPTGADKAVPAAALPSSPPSRPLSSVMSSPMSSPAVAFEAFLPTVSYPDHQGALYLAFLKQLHGALRPRAYLEIGTQLGEALALAECPSVAIDPWMMLDKTAFGSRTGLSLFQMSSETFFADHDPARYLGGPIELAFLDGPKLHYEIMLRDFINVERHATARSMILIHDVVPPDVYMTSRDRLDDFRKSRSTHPGWWTGDVWKVIGVLQKYRPDLMIDVFDASPSGLAMVRALDPASTTLSENYPQILQEVARWPSEEAAFAAYRAGLHLRSTTELPAILAQLERTGAILRYPQTMITPQNINVPTPYQPTFPSKEHYIDDFHRHLAEHPSDGFLVNLGVDGWLMHADALKLYELTVHTSGDVLELGTNRGLSAFIIATALKATDPTRRLITVDIDAGLIETARQNLTGKGVLEVVELRHGDANDLCLAMAAEGRCFEFVFVDHSHAYEPMVLACDRMHEVVAPGGFVLFHDYKDAGNHPLNRVLATVLERMPPDFRFIGCFGCAGLYQRA
jgi:predicted O-methyltransferase YrrM/capsular polysaccharide biosynthesis protein